MELSLQFLKAFLLVVFISAGHAAPTRITFEKCDYKGFTCQNSKNITGKVDVFFQCNTTLTTQDVMFYLWSFNSPPAITSFTIKDCDKVQISFTCTAENKPIQTLKIQNVGLLEIVPALLTHNPPEIIFDNIQLIENVPRNSFAQIKNDVYKPGCFIPVTDLNRIDFQNVNIGNIETEAFRNLSFMKGFFWNNVSVNRIGVGAVKLHFENESGGELKRCKFGVLEPMALQVVGDSFKISSGVFVDIWGSGFNATVYDFYFTNNSVTNIQSGAISILAQNVYILDNHFESIETGAFQKISPGLLFDSGRNFGRINFVYKFSNNLVENVEDGGIRPDIAAYKNVASDIAYTSNYLHCSCEGLSWHGTDIDLGFGHSIIKDFKTAMLDTPSNSTCSSTPCMCFGIKPPSRKNTPIPVAVF